MNLAANQTKIWADKGSKFYNRLMKSELQDNDIGPVPIHNEWISVVAKRFFRTLNNKMYKYMTSKSKMCILIN